MKKILLIISILMVSCIPNPLESPEDFDVLEYDYKLLSGTLYHEDLIENPGIWYWAIEVDGVVGVVLDNRPALESYDYVIEEGRIIIFEILGVEIVEYKITVRVKK